MRKIGWEKVENPVDELDDIKSDIQNMMGNIEDIDDDQEDSLQEPISMSMPIIEFEDVVVKTPIGPYSIDDPYFPYKMFDCWICHANFPITSKELSILEDEVEGLGCIKVMSKYTFFIGVEKMFAFSDVRVDIEKKLCGESSHDSGKIDSTLLKLKRYKKWACFVSNNGELEVVTREDCDSDCQFDDLVTDLKSKKDGNIITYETK